MKRITDISTVLGIGIAFCLVFFAIFFGGETNSNPLGFLDLRSFLIVLGGTYFLTVACFTVGEVWNAKLLVLRTVFYNAQDTKSAATSSIKLCELARKEGLLALQNHKSRYNHNPFLEKGISLVVDGIPYQEVDDIMHSEIEATLSRHHTSSNILRKASDIAPAMGLIGTLIGLVQMLGNLEDPATIGPAMAIALLTTLYGAMLSFMVFLPLASKLERNSHNEATLLQIYLDTIVFIGKRENPRKLELQLNAILPPEKRVHYFN